MRILDIIFGIHRKRGTKRGLDNILKENATNRRVGDGIMLIKFVLGEDIINIVSASAPQVGMHENIKREFWEMDGLIQEIFVGEIIYRRGSKWTTIVDIRGCMEVYRVKKDVRDTILDFATSYDL